MVRKWADKKARGKEERGTVVTRLQGVKFHDGYGSKLLPLQTCQIVQYGWVATSPAPAWWPSQHGMTPIPIMKGRSQMSSKQSSINEPLARFTRTPSRILKAAETATRRAGRGVILAAMLESNADVATNVAVE